jgi:hypothetical protein
LKIRIIIVYENKEIANSIVKALLPDDRNAPPTLKLKTWSEGTKLNSEIECKGRFETFMSTIDDMLASIQVAEKNLEIIK